MSTDKETKMVVKKKDNNVELTNDERVSQSKMSSSSLLDMSSSDNYKVKIILSNNCINHCFKVLLYNVRF